MLDFAMEVAEKHRNEGIAIGIEQGLEQGLEQGIERGIEQGIVRGRCEGVLRMHERGFTNEQIADILGLDLELVNEWLKQN